MGLLLQPQHPLPRQPHSRGEVQGRPGPQPQRSTQVRRYQVLRQDDEVGRILFTRIRRAPPVLQSGLRPLAEAARGELEDFLGTGTQFNRE